MHNMASKDDIDGAQVSAPQASQPKPKLVQVKKDELDAIMMQYRQFYNRNKKLETQLKAMTNLSDVIGKQEQMLKIYKKKAQQYESAYTASESKLGQCLTILMNSAKGNTLDMERLDHLLRIKEDELYTAYFTSDSFSDMRYNSTTTKQSQDTKTTPLSGQGDSHVIKKMEQDLEEDCQAENPSASGVKKVTFSSSDHVTSPTPEYATAAGNVLKSDDVSSIVKDVMRKLIADKRQMQSIIEEYRSEESAGWQAFIESKKYEDLVKNLRLEVANERIHNSQLRHLLAAKKDNNIDLLTSQNTELDRKVAKLTKQLVVKDTLLKSLKSEYDRVKSEKKIEISLATVFGASSVPVENQEDWEKQIQDLKAQFQTLLSAGEKEQNEMKRKLEELLNEKEHLLEQVKHQSDEMEQLQNKLLQHGEHIDSSWLYVKEENQRLQQEVNTYKHELQAKNKDNEIAEGQIKIYQNDCERLKEALKNESEKWIAREKEVERRLHLQETEKQQLQSQLHTKINENSELIQKYKYYKTLIDRMQSRGQHIQPTPSQHFFSDHLSRTPDIQTDGAVSSPEVSPAQYEVASGTNQKTKVEGRVVAGSSVLESRQFGLESDEANSNKKLECPNCYREFQASDRKKFEDHCKKCFIA